MSSGGSCPAACHTQPGTASARSLQNADARPAEVANNVAVECDSESTAAVWAVTTSAATGMVAAVAQEPLLSFPSGWGQAGAPPATE